MKGLKRINEELKSGAPDLSAKIVESVDWNAVAQKNKPTKTSEKAFRRPLGFSLVAAAVLAILIVPMSVIFIGKQKAPLIAYAAYDVVIDVNPNISLTVGKDKKVTVQKGLNEDGVVFLHNKNYVGLNIDDATRSIFTELKNKGLITSGSVVRISAFDTKTRVIKDDVQYDIENNLKDVLGEDVTLLFLSDEELDKIEDYYENHTLKEDEKKILNAFKEKVLGVANEKLANAKSISGILKKYTKSDTELTPDDAEKLVEFAAKYKIELDFNPYERIEYDDIKDFIEDVDEICEDLEKGIKKVAEKADDYSELMEELIDLIKDCLWD